MIFSWALYDLANQFFALNIVSLHFPRWLTIEKKLPEIFYSLAFGVSMLLVALTAPFLGAISDKKGMHRSFLVYLTFLSIIFTMFLGLPVATFFILIFFIIANFGCQEAIIFYNSLMKNVAPHDKIGLVSGLGRMFGYIGAILALYLTKPVLLKMGYGPVFFLTGALFLIFSLPCMVFVKEKVAVNTREAVNDPENFGSIFTLFRSHEFKKLNNFLKIAFCGLCVINTLILFMAVYAARVFGLSEHELVNVVAFSTIFAILGSILAGFLSDFIKHKTALAGILSLLGLSILVGGFARPPFHFAAGAMAGLSLGATWVIFRAMVIKLVRAERIGKAFGLFNLVGYLSGIIGPVLWGLILLYFSKFGEWGYRLALLSLIIFIVTGFVLLFRGGNET